MEDLKLFSDQDLHVMLTNTKGKEMFKKHF